jgi:hypothetical protein
VSAPEAPPAFPNGIGPTVSAVSPVHLVMSGTTLEKCVIIVLGDVVGVIVIFTSCSHYVLAAGGLGRLALARSVPHLPPPGG